MKKLFSYITLIGFIITSQMQLVHAFDMMQMDIGSTHHSMQAEKSIFCETDEKTKTTQCAKEIIPDKISSSRGIELKKAITNAYTLLILNKHLLFPPIGLPPVQNTRPPDITPYKNSYSNLVGIIKNLN